MTKRNANKEIRWVFFLLLLTDESKVIWATGEREKCLWLHTTHQISVLCKKWQTTDYERNVNLNFRSVAWLCRLFFHCSLIFECVAFFTLFLPCINIFKISDGQHRETYSEPNIVKYDGNYGIQYSMQIIFCLSFSFFEISIVLQIISKWTMAICSVS